MNWLVRTSGTARDPFTGGPLQTPDIREFAIPIDGGMVVDVTKGPTVLTGWTFPSPREAIDTLDRAGFRFAAYVRYVPGPLGSG